MSSSAASAPLSPGSRLGPYEILGVLGAGGMGEVYRARDSKLQRDVAIKVLPSSVASDPARLARFRREAQVLASLNHPHIGAIYGVEDSDRVALVLELVEGPTLAERIARGALSPDGRSIAFIADQKLKTVSLDGGTPAVLLDAIEGRGLSWGTDGNIYFNPRLGKGVSKVAASGGAATAVTAVGTEVQHRFPELLPDGSGLLFSALKNVSEEQVLVQSTRNGERRMLAAGFAPHYLPTGHLVYVQSGRLLAVRFDLAHLEVHGTPVVVLEGIEQTMWGTPLIAISRSGSMVYVPATGASHRNELVWVTPEGVESPIHVTGRIYHEPRLSPDGRTIVVGIRDTASDLWEYDIKRETWSRFTFDGVGDSPVWTPDGHKLTFNAGKAGPTDILWKPLDGSGPESGLLTSGDRLNVPFSWSPDGRTLAYVSIDPKTAQDIWTLTLDNERKPRPFLQTPFREGAPMFSPDGRWMTYVSDESGRSEVYVRPFPGPGQKWTISTEGGNEPIWPAKSDQLFYRNGDAMMAVDVRTTPEFSASKPRRLFERAYEASDAYWPNYDVSPDGRRFLMLRSVDAPHAAARQINIVLNWFEELKQRVP